MPPLLFGRQGGNHNDCFQQSLYHVPGEFTNYYARFLTFFRNWGKESFNNKKAGNASAFPAWMGFAQKKQPAKSRQAVLIPAVCRKGVRPPTKRLTALIEILPRISNVIGSGGFMLPIFPRNGRPANRVVLVRKHSLCVGRPPYKMDNTGFCGICQWNWKKIGALCNFYKST